MRAFIDAREPTGKAGYGLGLERYVLPRGLELVGHLGSSAGYRAFVGRLPAHDIDIAMVITTRRPQAAARPGAPVLVADAS